MAHRRPELSQKTFSLGFVVVSAGIEGDGAIMIAASNPVGIGQIRDCVGQIGIGVEQPGCGTCVAHATCRIMTDLHEAPVDSVPCPGVIAALSSDDPMNQCFRYSMGLGVLRHKSIDGGAVGGECWLDTSDHSTAHNETSDHGIPLSEETILPANVAIRRQLGYKV